MQKKNISSILYTVFAVILFSLLLGYLYRLRLPYILLLLCGEAVVIPFWIRVRKRAGEEQKRFAEANMYMEQMLYSFRKNPKILTALKDVEKLFADGDMKRCIGEAVDYVQDTYGEDLILEKALGIIERSYPAQRILHAHRLMLNVERLGGNFEESVKILLADRNLWEKETHAYQKRCAAQKRNIVMAVALSCLLCLMTPVLCQGALQTVNITGQFIYQFSTLCMLLFSMGICLYTEKYFAKDWLTEKAYRNSSAMLSKYEKVLHYDFMAAGKKSAVWAALAMLVLVLLAIGRCWMLVFLCCPLIILLLFQHKIDYSLARKAVIREIRKAFPDWLMEVSLLLQTENVSNSIQKSILYAPDILKPELNFLVQKLERAPESNIPYSEFLKDFEIPEISSAMGMLYSISDGSGSDAMIQLEDILERNAEWMSQSEILSNQDKMAKMYVLFLLPALIGACKMVVDMTLILFAFFASMHI
ncbi:MAG: hypothetical protein J6A92_06660 [Lachnospiraceae bacterium]|nr:hypothetical protein [Lachnospiraceae bacterium]